MISLDPSRFSQALDSTHFVPISADGTMIAVDPGGPPNSLEDASLKLSGIRVALKRGSYTIGVGGDTD